jgi:tight adherence protein B
MGTGWAVPIAVALLWCALLTALKLITIRSKRLPANRLTDAATNTPNRLSIITKGVVERLNTSQKSESGTSRLADAIEAAGLQQSAGDFIILVGAATLAASAAGLLIAGPVMGLLAAVLVVMMVKVTLGFLASRRRKAFADQIDDSLQLLSGSLQAGHSLLQALDAVSREAEKPTSAEFARLVNETRVGRDLADTLDEIAGRMGSDDFAWVAQAIAIHREVGGDLAGVLATVGQTIRERNQIRRQVGALSAEGKLSAVVLMSLPIGVTGFLSMTNPEYLSVFTHSIVGYSMLAMAGLMLLVGGLWMRKVVSFKF